MSRRICMVAMWSLPVLLAAAAASAQKTEGPPKVAVAKPVIQEVTDYEDFKGRVATNSVVKITPRVSGYIAKVLFKDGSVVKKGDVLFELDARLQQTQMAAVKAEVTQAKAHHDLAKAELERALALAQTPGVISRGELDQRKAQLEAAIASLELAKVKLTEAQLNLDWTRVTAPTDGKIDAARVPVGNFVKADSTVLATVVGNGPVLVDFDVDETTHLRMARLSAQAKSRSGKEELLPVLVRFLGETAWEHKGVIQRIGTQVAPETATVRWSAGVTDSPAEVLPGMSASVRLPIGLPHKAVLIAPQAIDRSTRRQVVWVVNDKNVTALRQVQLGRFHDGLVAVTEGLTPEEWVVIDWQKISTTGLTVVPERVEMPRALKATK